MTDKHLYLDVTGCGNVQSVSVSSSYSQMSASATIECTTTTLGMGDSVSIDLGYTDNHALVFNGYVKQIEKRNPDGTIALTCYDELIKAADFFIAADDPEAPFQRNNITSLPLIEDLLALASITNVDDNEPTPTFTWGTNADGVRFNLQTVADAVQFIASTTGNMVYADTSGVVYFSDRKPYIVDGDTATLTFADSGSSSNIISCVYQRSNEKTRNKIVVYGKTPLTASASASNPYLVVDQTVVIAHEMLDTQAICDGTASVNLTMLNRLTESYELEVLGDPAIQPRSIATITETFSGASNRKVFIYRVEHMWNRDGYICSLTATP